ncbi:unnamed protein product [Caenorhabditis bovis]|uniref:Uncharacterized protein n=1 Tax=Caenorhabditis bovis TaxID=2654633 RepID=A0A8S1EBP0_9PELO|nr:unnamed protein product [Caenorhabditis bovis]
MDDIHGVRNNRLPTFYNDDGQDIIKSKDVGLIESDLRRIMRTARVRRILEKLPRQHYYADLVGQCFNEKYYFYHYSGRISEITCPGPHMCEYTQLPNLKCVHVDATYPKITRMNPLTVNFATDARFSRNIGCYPH